MPPLNFAGSSQIPGSAGTRLEEQAFIQAPSETTSETSEPGEAAVAGHVPTTYAHRYRNQLAWSVLLATGYLLACVVCELGLPPYDCVHKSEAHLFFGDISKMTLFSFLSSFYNGLAEDGRFRYVFSRWYFYLAFVVSIPGFGAFNAIPGLSTSISTDAIKGWGLLADVVFPASGALVLFVLGWHVHHAFRAHKCPKDFAVYAISRAVPLVYFGATILVVKDLAAHKGRYEFHLHHYQIAFALSLFAEFNHPVSVVTLAIAAGIFVQGVGAFQFADLLEPR